MKKIFLLLLVILNAGLAKAGGGEGSSSEGGAGGYRYLHTVIARVEMVQAQTIEFLQRLSDEDFSKIVGRRTPITRVEMIDIISNTVYAPTLKGKDVVVTNVNGNIQVTFGERIFQMAEADRSTINGETDNTLISLPYLIFTHIFKSIGIDPVEARVKTRKIFQYTNVLLPCGIKSAEENVGTGIQDCQRKLRLANDILSRPNSHTVADIIEAEIFVALMNAIPDYELVGERVIMHVYNYRERNWSNKTLYVVLQHKATKHLYATLAANNTDGSLGPRRYLMAWGMGNCGATRDLDPLPKEELKAAQDLYESLKLNEHLAIEELKPPVVDMADSYIEGNKDYKVRNIKTGKQKMSQLGNGPLLLALITGPVSIFDRDYDEPRVFCKLRNQ